MNKPLSADSPHRSLLLEEEALLLRVQQALTARASAGDPLGGAPLALEEELLALRDQISEERLEDLPVLVEHMTRVQALAAGRQRRVALPIDAANPYFAHLRVKTSRGVRGRGRMGDGAVPPAERREEILQDVLIGKHGFIDRAAGVQVVDWRDAPISQIYYRYDEGDDYEEEVGDAHLEGEVLARRNVTVAASRLRRVGCPQGTFVASAEGRWFEVEGQGVALLGGGAGTAARPPRQLGPTAEGRGKGPARRQEVARPSRLDTKQLPEIAALLDGEQFSLITRPSTGLVVIQGGAGSGKTTVALHRIAYLVFHDQRVKPSHCLFVVPSEALSRYVSGVLPALGVEGVGVVTCHAWMRTLRQRIVPAEGERYSDETPPSVARLKKHPALLPALREAVAREVAEARASLVARLPEGPAAAHVLGGWDEGDRAAPMRRVRAARKRLASSGLTPAAVETAEQTLRRARGRLANLRRILWELLTDRGRLTAALGQGPDPATPREVEELVRWCSAQLDRELPPELEGIDEERLQAVDGRPLHEDGANRESAATGRLDREDDALLVRLYQLVHGQLDRVDGAPLVYAHIALDEAQDLSPVEVQVLYEALDERRSMTICGDVAQRVIFDNSFRGWESLLQDIGHTDGAAQIVSPLRLAYRSTGPIMGFAHELLGPLAPPGDPPPARAGAPVELHEFGGMGEAVAFLSEALRSLLSREPSASVALLTRHAGQAEAWFAALKRAEVPSLRRVRQQEFSFLPGIDVTEVGQCKGLEFDYVVLLDVNQASYPVTVESRHLLHIGATRATHQLWVLATDRVSPLVEGPESEGTSVGAPSRG